jgi:anti-sigma factor RsiW
MMRDCDFCEIHLTAYAAGELGATDCDVLEAHLADCADCRAELAREEELRGLLHGLPAATCPDRVARSLQDRLALDHDGATVGTGFRRRLRAGVAGLVAAALAGLLLVPVLRHDPVPVPAAGDATYTAAEIARARREVVAVLALTADVLARSRERTMTDVFGDRLPDAVSGSLRLPHAPDAHTPNSAPSASEPGGQG